MPRQAVARPVGPLGAGPANAAASAVINEWAAKERVEVTIDYIPSQGNKNLLTIAAEAQARSGHDILAMPTWCPTPMRASSNP